MSQLKKHNKVGDFVYEDDNVDGDLIVGGNLGVGTTPSGSKFEVAAGGAGGNLRVTTPGGNSGIVYGASNRQMVISNDDGMAIVAGNGTSTPSLASGVFVENGGNVGIGTANPERLLHLSANSPEIVLQTTSATPGANNKLWRLRLSAATGTLSIESLNDAISTAASAITISRSGTTITEVDVGSTLRADGLRLDVSPTAETITCTHTVTMSINGTNYKFPCRPA